MPEVSHTATALTLGAVLSILNVEDCWLSALPALSLLKKYTVWLELSVVTLTALEYVLHAPRFEELQELLSTA